MINTVLIRCWESSPHSFYRCIEIHRKIDEKTIDEMVENDKTPFHMKRVPLQWSRAAYGPSSLMRMGRGNPLVWSRDIENGDFISFQYVENYEYELKTRGFEIHD